MNFEKFINNKPKLKEKINSNYNNNHLAINNKNFDSRAFLLLNLETGDCERFLSVEELTRFAGYQPNTKCSLKQLLKSRRLKKKYKFFAYESDLIYWAKWAERRL